MQCQLHELDEYYSLSKRCGDLGQAILACCSTRGPGKPLRLVGFLQALLLTKVLRCHEAIKTLVHNGFSSEAASIAISQFEIALDMGYMGQSEERAIQWIDHRDEESQPWKVRTKIDEVYAAETHRRDFRRDWYKVLSQMKHGNPVAIPFAFPISGVSPGIYQFLTRGLDAKSDDYWATTILAFASLMTIDAVQAAVPAIGEHYLLPPGVEDESRRLREETSIMIRRAAESFAMSRDETVGSSSEGSLS